MYGPDNSERVQMLSTLCPAECQLVLTLQVVPKSVPAVELMIPEQSTPYTEPSIGTVSKTNFVGILGIGTPVRQKIDLTLSDKEDRRLNTAAIFDSIDPTSVSAGFWVRLSKIQCRGC